MRRSKLNEDEVHQFLQACEDFARLGCTFAQNIRVALEDLKKTYDPVLNSTYVDKGVVELLTRSLREFEKRVEANVSGINQVCSKGGKWFTFYLGKSVGLHADDQPKGGSGRTNDRKPSASSMETERPVQAQKRGA